MSAQPRPLPMKLEESYAAASKGQKNFAGGVSELSGAKLEFGLFSFA